MLLERGFWTWNILYKNTGHTRIKCFSDVDWVGSREVEYPAQDIVPLLEEI